MTEVERMNDKVTAEREKAEAAVHVVRGVRVVFDTTLSDWSGMKVEDLRAIVERNRGLIPGILLFSLDANEIVQFSMPADNLVNGEKQVPAFAFTVHGFLLFCACLDPQETWMNNSRFVILLDILSNR